MNNADQYNSWYRHAVVDVLWEHGQVSWCYESGGCKLPPELPPLVSDGSLKFGELHQSIKLILFSVHHATLSRRLRSQAAHLKF